MARKRVKKEFKPGDKVIWFSTYGAMSREPRIAWIPSEVYYPSVMKDRVRVTRHEEDAKLGLGILDSMKYVYPWDEELWEACERWVERRDKLTDDLFKLWKGRIPDVGSG